MRKIVGLTATCIAVGVALSGCGRELSDNVYKGAHVGETMETNAGVIINARQVVVENSEYLGEDTTGASAGAVAGALGGAALSNKTNSQSIAGYAAGGGLLGAGLGMLAQTLLSKQDAMEYIIQLTNGSMVTVVQGMEPKLSVGQKVFVLTAKPGYGKDVRRSRVIPAAEAALPTAKK